MFSSERRWNSFVAALCERADGKKSVVQAYSTYNDGWKPLNEFDDSDIDTVRPFHCVYPKVLFVCFFL
jgi:hypothetical protein